MKLHAFDIPVESSELPRWIEEQLVGLHLADVVAELAAVHGRDDSNTESLDQVLQEKKAAVLHNGLAALRLEQLQRLLRQPQLLLELQELVLIDGGTYWSDLSTRGEATLHAMERHRARVLPDSELAPTASVSVPQRTVWFRSPLVASLSTAAVLLIGFWMIEQSRQPTTPTSTAWGWNRPDAMRSQASREEYLTGLAAAADEWFKKAPSEPRELATRIIQFRTGCSTLILAEHPPLPGDDRKWLVEKCRAWAAKIDGHLAALEGGSSTADVRAAMDDTVRKLTVALRERAAQSAA